MKIDPFRIQYLRLAAGGEGYITDRNIQQIAENVETVATPFELIPEFANLRVEKS
jgi:hypothetical protein